MSNQGSYSDPEGKETGVSRGIPPRPTTRLAWLAHHVAAATYCKRPTTAKFAVSERPSFTSSASPSLCPADTAAPTPTSVLSARAPRSSSTKAAIRKVINEDIVRKSRSSARLG